MGDENWLYHLTTKSTALKIKTGGMTSALSRIGSAVANPNGSFTQNRLKMQETKFEQKLNAYLCEILARGCSKEKIKEVKGRFTPLLFVPIGSNETDIPILDNLEKQALESYCKLIPDLKVSSDRVKRGNFVKDATVKEFAKLLLRNDKNHFLARLAVQYFSFRYLIEEVITSSHVYFLKPQYAVDGYNDYKDNLNANDLVMLRINKNNVQDLVPDDSDQRAVMTKQTVGPNVIEIMVALEEFTNLTYRCNAENWNPLSTLM